ncbi:MAG: hypothetical protein E7467_03465 [Ruminococcaceae bacterium]|nr:hypothetical protein [Oscillospiraceae bacterium]
MKKLRKAFAHQTPDVLKNVLSACAATKGEISMNDKKWENVTPQKRTSPWMAIAAVAAVLALVIGIGWSMLGHEASQETHLTKPTTELTVESTEPTEVTSEPVQMDWTVELLVEHFQIAPARAHLVWKAWMNNPDTPIEELVYEDIQTLIVMSGVQIHLGASEIDYSNLKQIVLDHAGQSDVWNYIGAFQGELYTATFCAGTQQYSYEVDRISGEILKHEATENPVFKQQTAVADKVYALFADLRDMAMEKRPHDLTVHLARQDSEVWADAIDFPPYVNSRLYYDEIYLSNQVAYIMEFVDYWLESNEELFLLDISYDVECINVKGSYAQVLLCEEKAFHYFTETEDSFLTSHYELMLVYRNDQWEIFDIATEENVPRKYASEDVDTSELVVEDYASSYQSYDGTELVTWHQAFPKIMIDSAYADKINAKIATIRDDFINWEKSEHSLGVEYSYEYYTNDDFLTLIFVSNRYETYDPQYHIYTIHVSNGKKATREEIMAYCHVSEEELSRKAHWIIANNMFSDADKEPTETMLNRAIENPEVDGMGIFSVVGKTLCFENIQNMTVYPGKDGQMCFQATVYQIAGADSHTEEHTLDEQIEKSPYYDRMMEHLLEKEFAIYDYMCLDALKSALADAGATQRQVSDLSCIACYSLSGRSYFKICFTYEGKTFVRYFDAYS